jgi:molybdate transport system substrate-binding protein
MVIRRLIRRVFMGGFMILMAAAAWPVQAKEPVVVFATASLKNALDEIITSWRANKGGESAVSYEASSALAQQIVQGAPADIFISANVEWMDFLASKKLLRTATRRDLLTNTLVLIASGKTAAPLAITPSLDLRNMLRGGRLAMAMVDSVPAGMYGKAALVSLGLWSSVAGQVAQVDNVRAALLLVARGEAPLGIVYASDANAEDNVSVIGVFPANSHPPIIYPAAVTAQSTHPRALPLLDYLSSDAARAVFVKHGFQVLQ